MSSNRSLLLNPLSIVCTILLIFNFIGCGNTKNTSLNETVSQEGSIEDGIKPDTLDVTPPIIDEAQLRRDSLTQVYKEELYNENQSKANRVTTFYILAQQKFYNGEFEEALFLINQATRVKETADVLALKGSIYLGLGSTENFVAFWKRALELDKNLPLPPSPNIIQELKKQGLINENPDKNFEKN